MPAVTIFSCRRCATAHGAFEKLTLTPDFYSHGLDRGTEKPAALNVKDEDCSGAAGPIGPIRAANAATMFVSSASWFDAHPRCGTFQYDFLAEAVELGWPPAGSCFHFARGLNETGTFHQPPEILLVQVRA